MKKKFIIGIIILVMILGGFGIYYFAKEYQEKKELEKTLANYSTPLLYKVTEEDSDTTIYLFGSIHLADSDAYPLPNEVMNAYNNSDYLAVEFDTVSFNKDFDAQMDMAAKMVFTDGKMIEDVLNPPTYELLIPYLEKNNSYINLYEYYKPAFFYSLVSNIAYEKSGLKSTKGIDMHFLNLALEENKNIIEMESSDYQTEMLLSFSNELYDLLIKDSIEHEEEAIKEINNLYKAWLKGNEKELIKLLTEEDNGLSSVENKLMEEYEEKLITQRNNEMTEKTNQYFKEEKNVFVVVGLAHIIGDNGIKNQLQDKGYKVEKIKIDTTKLREHDKK